MGLFIYKQKMALVTIKLGESHESFLSELNSFPRGCLRFPLPTSPEKLTEAAKKLCLRGSARMRCSGVDVSG